ncbi:MAG: thiolase family protein [Halioglobus sp.]|nr:thiolase family protein [Halioglobus sp.]
MRTNAIVAGVGMTRFGKHLDQSIKQLGGAPVLEAIKDAGIDMSDIQAAYVGNCAAGTVTGQESIRGQVILSSIGLGKIPIINIENACGSSSTALNQAAMMISAGYYDVVLVCGVEKLFHENKMITYAAFSGAVDVEVRDEMIARLSSGQSAGSGENRSMFTDFYGVMAREHMEHYGSTAEHFAMVTAKNSFHASMNPKAQYTTQMTVAEVLAEPLIVDPLTRPMLCPVADGGAAVVLVSPKKARELGISEPVTIVSSVLHSYYEHPKSETDHVTAICVAEAYDEAGFGPEDLDVVELHDSSSPCEILSYEHLHICEPGKSVQLLADGDTRLGGRIPVNTSGGLLRKGHPVGATGVSQIIELTLQLQGRAGKRQVEGAARALAHNGGGTIGNEVAAMNITILSR